jgi:RNA binding exosome subunit
MAGAFHWTKVRLFCYATEDEEKLRDLIVSIAGTDEIDEEVSDGHHGNRMIIFSADLKGDAECGRLFGRLGKDIVTSVIDDIDNRMDDDCTFYMRIDKQSAVSGVYEIAHHGDVVSVTCKVASHPARKEIAAKNMRRFLENVLGSI